MELPVTELQPLQSRSARSDGSAAVPVGHVRELIRFQALSLPPLSDVAPYFAESERSRWFSNGGPCASRLERACADHLGLTHPGVAVNNATSGLLVALRACLGAPEGDRRLVALPSFTFAASVNAIIWAGFEPVYVDIDPEDWHVGGVLARPAADGCARRWPASSSAPRSARLRAPPRRASLAEATSRTGRARRGRLRGRLRCRRRGRPAAGRPGRRRGLQLSRDQALRDRGGRPGDLAIR